MLRERPVMMSREGEGIRQRGSVVAAVGRAWTMGGGLILGGFFMYSPPTPIAEYKGLDSHEYAATMAALSARNMILFLESER